MGYSKLTKKSIPILYKCSPRTAGICKITPHYMAGDMAAENCAVYHRDSDRLASANYYIGSDGTIVSGVDELSRAWTSSSEWNDSRAITIECANTDNDSGALTDACYKSLVKLCADVCSRFGIDPHYTGSADGTITYHAMFASTSCPGPWLLQKIQSGQLEKGIKSAMSPKKPATVPAPAPAASKPRPEKIAKGAARSVYRLYNPNNGDHLYTTDVNEANLCQDGGWAYEGIGWVYPAKGDPVWRLRHKSGIHHFTGDENEKDFLTAHDWTSEGIVFRSAGAKPIYRLYNPNSGQHILTAKKKEHDALSFAGWVCEGQDLHF